MKRPANITSYNRQEPLLERKRVPCELILSSTSSNNAGGEVLSKTKVFYTLRLLEGQRPINNLNGGGTERAIKLELSNEYSKFHNLTTMDDHHQSTHFPQTGHHSPKIGSSVLSSPNVVPSNKVRIPHSIGCIGLSNSASPLRQSGVLCSNDFMQKNNSCIQPVASTDPIHLYDLEVGESDFSDLQQDQALLVEFSNFAKSFIDLLRQCDLGESDENQVNSSNADREVDSNHLRGCSFSGMNNNSNPLLGCQFDPNSGIVGKKTMSLQQRSTNISQMNSTYLESEEIPSSSKYFCRIEDFTTERQQGGGNKWNGNHKNHIMARFSIVESNQFRELTHLSLNLKSGSDESIRSYLSVRLVETLGINAVYCLKLKKERDRIDEAEKACNSLTHQYNELLKQSETERSVLAQEAGETIQKEQTRRLEDMHTIQKEKDFEIEKMKSNSEKLVKSLQSRIEELATQNAQLIKDRSGFETGNQKLTEALSHSETSLHHKEIEIAAIKKDLNATQQEREFVEDRLRDCQTHIQQLEESNEYSQKTLAQSEEQIQRTSETISHAKSELEVCNSHLADKEKENRKLEEELAQTKEFLERYQRDRQEMKRRMKSKVELIRKQEEFLSAKEMERSETQEREEELSREIERLRIDGLSMEKALTEVKQQLDERQKTIDNNQKVISWLNKQINDAGATSTTATNISNSNTCEEAEIGSDMKDYIEQKTSNSQRLACYTTSMSANNNSNMPFYENDPSKNTYDLVNIYDGSSPSGQQRRGSIDIRTSNNARKLKPASETVTAKKQRKSYASTQVDSIGQYYSSSSLGQQQIINNTTLTSSSSHSGCPKSCGTSQLKHDSVPGQILESVTPCSQSPIVSVSEKSIQIPPKPLRGKTSLVSLRKSKNGGSIERDVSNSPSFPPRSESSLEPRQFVPRAVESYRKK